LVDLHFKTLDPAGLRLDPHDPLAQGSELSPGLPSVIEHPPQEEAARGYKDRC